MLSFCLREPFTLQIDKVESNPEQPCSLGHFRLFCQNTDQLEKKHENRTIVRGRLDARTPPGVC